MERRILLVEDNPDDIELTIHALKEARILNPIDVVRDGQAALDFLFSSVSGPEAAHAWPALILLDLKLPKVDGLSVLKTIRARQETRCIPVVVLTTSDEDWDRVESYELGANSYIRKPVAFDAFTKVVANLGMYWMLLNELPRQI